LSGRVETLLANLEEARRLRPSGGRVEKAIHAAARAQLPDAESLLRFHEAVLFLRAYPQTRGVFAQAERALASIPGRVARLERAGADLSQLDTPEVSGIARTAVTTDYSYDVVRWLAERHPGRVGIDWEGFSATDRLRALWPRFLPLLEEEALEDANVPYLDWLRASQTRRGEDLAWLLERLALLPVSENERAERYDALGLSVAWRLSDFAATRTGQRWPTRAVFFHDTPLLSRRDVSLKEELEGPPLSIERVSARLGRAVIQMTRTATALRYREYYGFTYADPATVRRARVGRGVEIFLFGLSRERRLPLRGGFAAFFVKNGIPAGYVEALAFFERIEVGFNIYYSFRDGESAWIFGKVVRLLRQVLGARSFSIDPYQIGHENVEAIESGAFWFYRKMGFRSTSARLRALTEAQERKLQADPSYRTPPRILRRLATQNVLYEAPSSASASEWDRFHIRNLGLAVNRAMAREFRGDAAKIRAASSARVARALKISLSSWSARERAAFQHLALVLHLIRDLPRWTRGQKRDLVAVIRAKAGPDEARYLRRMQAHAKLREALVRLGSRS
jgi:hypothetical protein